MAANGKLRKFFEGYAAYCPACEEYHIFDLRWKFNGDFNSPTFTPSMLVTDERNGVCHSFIVNGEWRYLSDCSHSLAGCVAGMRDEEALENAETDQL